MGSSENTPVRASDILGEHRSLYTPAGRKKTKGSDFNFSEMPTMGWFNTSDKGKDANGGPAVYVFNDGRGDLLYYAELYQGLIEAGLDPDAVPLIMAGGLMGYANNPLGFFEDDPDIDWDSFDEPVPVGWWYPPQGGFMQSGAVSEVGDPAGPFRGGLSVARGGMPVRTPPRPNPNLTTVRPITGRTALTPNTVRRPTATAPMTPYQRGANPAARIPPTRASTTRKPITPKARTVGAQAILKKRGKEPLIAGTFRNNTSGGVYSLGAASVGCPCIKGWP